MLMSPLAEISEIKKDSKQTNESIEKIRYSGKDLNKYPHCMHRTGSGKIGDRSRPWRDYRKKPDKKILNLTIDYKKKKFATN